MIDNAMNSKELPDWFIDLLLLRATDGLDREQRNQFDQFVSDHPDRDWIELEAEKYELSAAAIDLGIENVNPESPLEPMPAALRQKVIEGAERHFQTATTPAPQADGAIVQAHDRESGLTSREALAWLAAAAAVVLLLTGWNPFAAPARAVVDNESVVQSVSIDEQYTDFVSSQATDLVRISWAPQGDSVATGEVVWRDSLQQGFMVFEGLLVNDPLESQYQLWIFDTDAGQAHPVDGGVFDIDSEQRTVVAIDAKISVGKAVMFAITEETPGGVVVSDRKRLPLLAVVQ